MFNKHAIAYLYTQYLRKNYKEKNNGYVFRRTWLVIKLLGLEDDFEQLCKQDLAMFYAWCKYKSGYFNINWEKLYDKVIEVNSSGSVFKKYIKAKKYYS